MKKYIFVLFILAPCWSLANHSFKKTKEFVEFVDKLVGENEFAVGKFLEAVTNSKSAFLVYLVNKRMPEAQKEFPAVQQQVGLLINLLTGSEGKKITQLADLAEATQKELFKSPYKKSKLKRSNSGSSVFQIEGGASLCLSELGDPLKAAPIDRLCEDNAELHEQLKKGKLNEKEEFSIRTQLEKNKIELYQIILDIRGVNTVTTMIKTEQETAIAKLMHLTSLPFTPLHKALLDELSPLTQTIRASLISPPSK